MVVGDAADPRVTNELGLGILVGCARRVWIAQRLLLDALERFLPRRRLGRRIVPLVLIRAGQREEELERATLVLLHAVVRREVQRRRCLAVLRELGEDVFPQRDRLRVVRGDAALGLRLTGLLDRDELLFDDLVREIDIQIREAEHRVGRELLVVRVIDEELLEQRDGLAVLLALHRLGLGDAICVALREVRGPRVVLATRDRAHARVVLRGRLRELLEVGFDLGELALLLGGELDRRGHLRSEAGAVSRSGRERLRLRSRIARLCAGDAAEQQRGDGDDR